MAIIYLYLLVQLSILSLGKWSITYSYIHLIVFGSLKCIEYMRVCVCVRATVKKGYE